MTTNPFEALQARLDRLERQNCRLKRAGLAGLVVLGAGLALGFADQARPKPLEASQLILRDEEGNERGRLIVSKDGLALACTDEGAVRSSLVLSKNSGALKYYGQGRAPVSGVSAQSNGVGLGYRTGRDKADVGVNALMDVLGNTLTADPILAPQEKRP